MNKILIFVGIKLSFLGQICFGSLSDLSELHSVLTSLANTHQNQNPTQKDDLIPDYFSDPDFFTKLVEKTTDVRLKRKLTGDIKKLEQLPTSQQQLAKYLLHFLFENKGFSDRYLNGGLYPDYSFTLRDDDLFANGSTDLIARILLVVTMVSDIEKHWKPNEEIGIVSLAGGYLLQDYILIKALNFMGYNKIKIYVIDSKDHTNNLQAIIKNDASLKEDDISIEHYPNTSQFLSSGRKAINVCYLVSPTGDAPGKISNIKDQLNGHMVNLLRVGRAPERSISFYIPYDHKFSFAKSDLTVDPTFVKDIIKNLNESLNPQFSDSSITNAFVAFEKKYPTNLYGVDDIMLDFYDIIKHSSAKNCLGYMALGDQIRQYQNVKDEPYWALNYKIKISDQDKLGIVWEYNSDKNRFEQF